ncbi:vacuolar ATP synthase subunit f, putative [Eimeria mitis]|uniref:Vacuolar ATP synthase subunit f, putative n=1 Tax=Eimeria mitis TaxID=44415 RepID=U6K6C7_9EIME|nr:vacuolar ATP synthase subunit f, putative [Eimeria mitis]CDJ33509.1 vacuolar ATP synthase subunit f, putative [Eimeria mitis]
MAVYRGSIRPHGAAELKICVIGDEDTVAGFLMAGIGMRDGMGRTNFLVVDAKTKRQEVERAFHEFTHRNDVGIVLINQHQQLQQQQQLLLLQQQELQQQGLQQQQQQQQELQQQELQQQELQQQELQQQLQQQQQQHFCLICCYKLKPHSSGKGDK